MSHGEPVGTRADEVTIEGRVTAEPRAVRVLIDGLLGVADGTLSRVHFASPIPVPHSRHRRSKAIINAWHFGQGTFGLAASSSIRATAVEGRGRAGFAGAVVFVMRLLSFILDI